MASTRPEKDEDKSITGLHIRKKLKEIFISPKASSQPPSKQIQASVFNPSSTVFLHKEIEKQTSNNTLTPTFSYINEGEKELRKSNNQSTLNDIIDEYECLDQNNVLFDARTKSYTYKYYTNISTTKFNCVYEAVGKKLLTVEDVFNLSKRKLPTSDIYPDPNNSHNNDNLTIVCPTLLEILTSPDGMAALQRSSNDNGLTVADVMKIPLSSASSELARFQAKLANLKMSVFETKLLKIQILIGQINLVDDKLKRYIKDALHHIDSPLYVRKTLKNGKETTGLSSDDEVMNIAEAVLKFRNTKTNNNSTINDENTKNTDELLKLMVEVKAYLFPYRMIELYKQALTIDLNLKETLEEKHEHKSSYDISC